MEELLNRELDLLARLYGVQISYWNVFGELCRTSQEATIEVLKALGASVRGLEDVPGAIRSRRGELWRQIVEPIAVVWGGEAPSQILCIPAGWMKGSLHAELVLEEGGLQRWEASLDSLEVAGGAEIEGSRYLKLRLPIPMEVPFGYHTLNIELADEQVRSLLISAPRRVVRELEGVERHRWGVFLPLHSLYSARSLGVGDLGDLGALAEWIAELGGSFVGVLPLLSAFHDKERPYSPYAPSSRLFWNEIFLDLSAIPGYAGRGDRSAVNRPVRSDASAAVPSGVGFLDYPAVESYKRELLKELAGRFFELPGAHETGVLREGFERFIEEKEFVKEYARFKAASHRYGPDWRRWPAPMKDGSMGEDDIEEEDYRYHLFVQWQLSEQLSSLDPSRGGGAELYLDYPVGVPPISFDVWHFRDLFLSGFSVGAPPDTFFRKGQRWGFPPVNHFTIRADGYRYFISGIRNHLQYAGILRLDHIMGLHRLYWIPDGFDADQGAYVRRRVDELYAILLLEATRSGSVLVGEDLGTVPIGVRARMKEHGILGMYVLQVELKSDPTDSPGKVGTDRLASLNTHDMPLFTSFWHDGDTELLLRLGHLDEEATGRITRERKLQREALIDYLRREGWLRPGAEDIAAIIEACHKYLAAGTAPTVMVNLEDLWQERQSQNVPGTTDELPNWRRRSRYSLEEITAMTEVTGALLEIDRLRRGKG